MYGKFSMFINFLDDSGRRDAPFWTANLAGFFRFEFLAF